jgi:hypothetical protein
MAQTQTPPTQDNPHDHKTPQTNLYLSEAE